MIPWQAPLAKALFEHDANGVSDRDRILVMSQTWPKRPLRLTNRAGMDNWLICEDPDNYPPKSIRPHTSPDRPDG
jgi:hypothetical protein